ncbi:MAG: NuA4 histone H4 acetyltransferase complex and the SWR1 complex subunit [Bathelium mastoideum]|nr:MAG: NuA4 histone H4 acetyltransferase complex and the SWR1 complex subunit [Bathelium mastoideum]
MAAQGTQQAGNPDNSSSSPFRRRRRSRYQLDPSSGLAGEEAEAERRGVEAAFTDAPRQTRGVKLNFANIANNPPSVSIQRVQTPAQSAPLRTSSPDLNVSSSPTSSTLLEPGAIPIKLYSDQKSPQGTKRVKGVSVQRAFIIGSHAWALDESNKPEGTPPDHTKGWKVYVKGTENGPDITFWLKKVQFKLHHTYANSTRTVESPPFEIHETGWGGFQVEIRLFFVPEAAEKPQWRSHLLQLEPYGGEAEQAAQRARNLVVSEWCEIVDFNEPVEPFFARLTDDAQWSYMDNQGKGAGRGKGKARQTPGQAAVGTVPKEERTAQLPARSTPGNQFSRETEGAMLDMLRKAREKVNEQIEEEKKKATERAAEIRELQDSGDFQQQTRRR